MFILAFRTVYIESPCKLSYKSGYLVVRKEDDTVKLHLSEVSTIILQTMQVFISAYLMAELAKNKISLVVSDEKVTQLGSIFLCMVHIIQASASWNRLRGESL